MINKLFKRHTILLGFFVLFTINFMFAYVMFIFMFSYIYYKFSKNSLSNTIQFFASIIYALSYFVVLFIDSYKFEFVFLYLIYFIFINTLLSKLFTSLNKIPKRYNIHESNFDTQIYILKHLDELVLTTKSNINNNSIKLKNEVYYTAFVVVDDIVLFREISYKNIIIECVKYWQSNRGLIIYNWCLMDDSLHLIASSKENNLKNILDDLKSYISQVVVSSIKSNAKESFKEMILLAMKHEENNNQLWKKENKIECILLKDIAFQKINYIHNIPVELGIVAKSEEYLYSSAIDYGIRSGLLDVELIS